MKRTGSLRRSRIFFWLLLLVYPLSFVSGYVEGRDGSVLGGLCMNCADTPSPLVLVFVAEACISGSISPPALSISSFLFLFFVSQLIVLSLFRFVVSQLIGPNKTKGPNDGRKMYVSSPASSVRPFPMRFNF